MAGASAETEAGRAEHRWPAAVAICVAIALYATLPSGFTPGLRYTVVGLCAALFIPLLVINPHRLRRETGWSRLLSRAVAGVLLAANLFALGQLVVQLVTPQTSSGELLLAAVQVWVTNAIVFALVFWEMDRGGPVVRRHPSSDEVPDADFRFPQEDDRDSEWMPGYIDYLYTSASNCMAFSATDVMPLTQRAKLLMLVEAVSGFVILALVIARAVNTLS